MWNEDLIWRNYKKAEALFEQLGGTYREERGYLYSISSAVFPVELQMNQIL